MEKIEEKVEEEVKGKGKQRLSGTLETYPHVLCVER